MKTFLFLSISVVVLVGCDTFHQIPPGVARIKLDRVDSPHVFIEGAVFERDQGQLVLSGSVMRRVGVEDTTQTRLKVALFDESGKVLREIPAEFEPHDIPRGPKMSGWSEYRIPIDPLPPETVRVEIRAYESVSGG